jgi:hypothetical protein
LSDTAILEPPLVNLFGSSLFGMGSNDLSLEA